MVVTYVGCAVRLNVVPSTPQTVAVAGGGDVGVDVWSDRGILVNNDASCLLFLT